MRPGEALGRGGPPGGTIWLKFDMATPVGPTTGVPGWGTSGVIASIAVHGVDKAYGTGRSAAGWKLWAATTGGRLVAIDPDRLECVEHIRFPVSTWPLRKFALASRGQVLAAAFGGARSSASQHACLTPGRC